MTHPSVNSIVERLPGLPDDHEDFTPDLAMKIMEKYREIIGQRDTIISELQAERDALSADLEKVQTELDEENIRALTAESSLSRIKEETIEALQQIETVCIDNAGDTVRHDLALKFVGGLAAKAIRSLGSTGGAEKTAESDHPPSTQTTATE